MNPNALHTIALDSLPTGPAPIRWTRRARIIRDIVAGGLILAVALFGGKPAAAATLALGEWWTGTALPALTLAAPVGVPVLGASLVFLLIVRVDRGR